MRRRKLALGLFAVALGGCSADRAEDTTARRQAVTREEARPASRPQPQPKPSHCPPDLSNCKTTSGRIIYVERVDPDGDGDAHFVLLSRDPITLPGLSVIDVEKSRRPSPLPGPGDRMSAAGPVYSGSYGQRQIEAIELHVARAR